MQASRPARGPHCLPACLHPHPLLKLALLLRKVIDPSYCCPPPLPQRCLPWPAGIGSEPGLKREAAEAEEAGGGSDAGHRVLVFAQLKGLLDLVESEVLAPLRVSSLRIDGSVDAAERFRRWVGGAGGWVGRQVGGWVGSAGVVPWFAPSSTSR